MIRILEKGHVSREIKFARVRCEECETLFEADRSEVYATPEHDVLFCPICDSRIYVVETDWVGASGKADTEPIETQSEGQGYVELIGLHWCVENLRDAAEDEHFDHETALNEAERQGLRLPTSEEFEALYKECVWEWNDEKKGYWVSDREHTERRIFLPASGSRHHNTGPLIQSGTFGRYWSSTAPGPSPTCAFYLGFHSSRVSPSTERYRAYGFSVRCVAIE